MSRRRQFVDTPAPAAPPQLRRCRVEMSVLAQAYEYGCTLGPGKLVDLDERVADGVTLRDLVRDEWFDPPSPTASGTDLNIDRPAVVAGESEEHDHGA